MSDITVVLQSGELEQTIDAIYASTARRRLSENEKLFISRAVDLLDEGDVRIAAPSPLSDRGWVTSQWLKKAVALYIRSRRPEMMGPTPEWFDKMPLKFANWSEDDFLERNLRVVPGAVVRYGAYLGQNVVVMPSFINIGAYVGDDTMIDTWSTVGSCAQIGKRCHISGGVGIGGVLEPVQAEPVIIEDNVFIGARSEIAEGVIVRTGAVLSMGCFVGASTPIYNESTDEVTRGEIPEYAVVVPGTHKRRYCVRVVKTRDAKTDARVALNDALR